MLKSINKKYGIVPLLAAKIRNMHATHPLEFATPSINATFIEFARKTGPAIGATVVPMRGGTIHVKSKGHHKLCDGSTVTSSSMRFMLCTKTLIRIARRLVSVRFVWSKKANLIPILIGMKCGTIEA